jgi:hypothetical protein
MSLKRFLPALIVPALCGLLHAADIDRLPAWHARAYSLIQPTSAELKWQRIPWLTNLEEAVKQAKAEKRPLLVWTAGDDPLERC